MKLSLYTLYLYSAYFTEYVLNISLCYNIFVAEVRGQIFDMEVYSWIIELW